MLRIRRSGRRSTGSLTLPFGIAVDDALRSERSRRKDAQARGDVHCGRNPSKTLTKPSLYRVTGEVGRQAGFRVCSELKFAVLLFCATLVAEPSLEDCFVAAPGSADDVSLTRPRTFYEVFDFKDRSRANSRSAYRSNRPPDNHLCIRRAKSEAAAADSRTPVLMKPTWEVGCLPVERPRSPRPSD